MYAAQTAQGMLQRPEVQARVLQMWLYALLETGRRHSLALLTEVCAFPYHQDSYVAYVAYAAGLLILAVTMDGQLTLCRCCCNLKDYG